MFNKILMASGLAAGTVATSLSPVFAGDRALTGFYAGGEVSFGETLFRGFNNHPGVPDETYTQDFGTRSEWRPGGFVGYGMAVGNWFVAPEFKLNSDGDATLDAHPVPDANYALTQKYTYGGGLRLGYFMRPGILFYGRADVLRSEFDASFYAPPAPQENFQETRTLKGWDAGFGTEVAVGAGFSVKGEYLWSEFESFNRATNGQEPYSSLFKLGVAYHLGSSVEEQDRPVDFSGAFIGVHGGVGDAASIELQQGYDPNANDTFYFGRGAHGAVLGGYAGYGVMLSNFYLAGEAEADWLNVEMSEDVADGTRNGFRISNTYGVSVLPGYRIANAALLFGRIGYVNSDVEYLTNTAPGNQGDRLSGLRVGAGLQIAVTEDVMLRWDYTHTRYETLHYTDPDGHQNILKPQENLFRLGLGYQY